MKKKNKIGVFIFVWLFAIFAPWQKIESGFFGIKWLSVWRTTIWPKKLC